MTARRAFAAPLVAAVAVALACGIAGGLARTGITVTSAAWLGHAAVFHAALMICSFFGTVIGVERAVATKQRLAWIAPFASGAAGVAIVAGASSVAAGLLVLASLAFLVVNAMLWQRERAAHTLLLACAAASWAIGNVLFATGHPGLEWWFGFLVVTIAAERLEMTRLMPRRPRAQLLLAAIMVLLALGAALSPVLFGVSLAALAAWLLAFDIARRTIRAAGLTRFMAVSLIAGYVWLAIGGIAWALGVRDVALHSLGLGFIVSMVMAHAPVILPAVTGIKLAFGRAFYLPLAVLHAGLAYRFAASQSQGAVMNAIAIALFALTMIGSALVQRKSRPKAA